MLELKFKGADNGNCRVYYTAPLKAPARRLGLYCLQRDFPPLFALYRCSQDGEPDYPVSLTEIEAIEDPSGDERIEQELREFLVEEKKFTKSLQRT